MMSVRDRDAAPNVRRLPPAPNRERRGHARRNTPLTPRIHSAYTHTPTSYTNRPHTTHTPRPHPGEPKTAEPDFPGRSPAQEAVWRSMRAEAARPWGVRGTNFASQFGEGEEDSALPRLE
eukprot:3505199-Rhodomonas_salina.1